MIETPSSTKSKSADRAPLAAVSWTTVMSDRIGLGPVQFHGFSPPCTASFRPISMNIDFGEWL
ncbi:MAG TPA: hypothetical protein VF548_09680 [Allosphingosinicella sp.]